jgi:hypothetical protein
MFQRRRRRSTTVAASRCIFCVVTHIGPISTVTAKKTTVIIAVAKKRLRDYFIAAQWSLNRNLDTGQKFLLSDVGRMIASDGELGLKRTQVSRQLLRDTKRRSTGIPR